MIRYILCPVHGHRRLCRHRRPFERTRRRSLADVKQPPIILCKSVNVERCIECDATVFHCAITRGHVNHLSLVDFVLLYNLFSCAVLPL